MAPFGRPHTSSYSSSIVTMAVSCTVFETKRDIGRKTPIFDTPLYLTCTNPPEPLRIFAPNFNTNCPSRSPREAAQNIAEKFKSLPRV